MKNIPEAGIGNQRGIWARRSALVLLAIVAVGLLVTLGLGSASQSVPTTGGDKPSVFVVAGQISRETYGVYLVDYDNSTICVYQYFRKDRKLRLMAARTYAFDVQLDEYNTDPSPRKIKKMVEEHKRLNSKELNSKE